MASTSAQTVLPDEISEIFLRLDAAADLARASAACSSFRRILSERRFFRRFRCLHSPPVLGFIRYVSLEFLPVGPPHRSAPEARALVRAADFTFSFLPGARTFRFRHARDGRVLLSRRLSSRQRSPGIAFEEFVVCDPLHRRHVKIPRVPDDLLASNPHTGTPRFKPVLAPAGENEEERSFSVICMVLSKDKAKCAIVEAEEGRLGFLTIADGAIDMYYCKNWQRNGVGAQEWQHDKLVPLPKHSGINYHWSIEGPAGRYLALVAQRIIRAEPTPYPEHFVLDIKTSLLEKLCALNSIMFYGFPYARFPPPFALPCI